MGGSVAARSPRRWACPVAARPAHAGACGDPFRIGGIREAPPASTSNRFGRRVSAHRDQVTPDRCWRSDDRIGELGLRLTLGRSSLPSRSCCQHRTVAGVGATGRMKTAGIGRGARWSGQ